MQQDTNLQVFSDPNVVSYYENYEGLEKPECYLFEKYLDKDINVLDIGVGAGRTTPYLSGIAKNYVGIDYSNSMIKACRKAYPSLDFRHLDAVDLSSLDDGEFDAVVFSFNGLATIQSDFDRARCIKEVSRVLKKEGVFIFSLHNAHRLLVWPMLEAANGCQIPWRLFRATLQSVRMAARAFTSARFYTGEGYMYDRAAHGGMNIYTAAPKAMKRQLDKADFTVLEIVGDRYPSIKSKYFSCWYYYACRKNS